MDNRNSLVLITNGCDMNGSGSVLTLVIGTDKPLTRSSIRKWTVYLFRVTELVNLFV